VRGLAIPVLLAFIIGVLLGFVIGYQEATNTLNQIVSKFLDGIKSKAEEAINVAQQRDHDGKRSD
jgi:Na+/H+-dicarboxylate symporter